MHLAMRMEQHFFHSGDVEMMVPVGCFPKFSKVIPNNPVISAAYKGFGHHRDAYRCPPTADIQNASHILLAE